MMFGRAIFILHSWAPSPRHMAIVYPVLGVLFSGQLLFAQTAPALPRKHGGHLTSLGRIPSRGIEISDAATVETVGGPL